MTNVSTKYLAFALLLSGALFLGCDKDGDSTPTDTTPLDASTDAAPGDTLTLTLDGVPISRIFKNEDFGYRTITVERPVRDEKGKVVLGVKGKGKGKPVPDTSLRDTENVPLGEDVETYFEREVLPHAPDAWIDHEKTKIGYEIPFNRHFYVYQPPRDLAAIAADITGLEKDIVRMLAEVTK